MEENARRPAHRVKRCTSCSAPVASGIGKCGNCGASIRTSKKSYFQRKKKVILNFIDKLLDSKINLKD